MKLVIDIDEELYKNVIEHTKEGYIGSDVWIAVAKGEPYEDRSKGEWVRKEDIIHYIATQYSEHNELVPIWLSIEDLKGGAE